MIWEIVAIGALPEDDNIPRLQDHISDDEGVVFGYCLSPQLSVIFNTTTRLCSVAIRPEREG